MVSFPLSRHYTQLLLGAFLIIGYLYTSSGPHSFDKAALSRLQAGSSCTSEIFQALPYLKQAYGDSMRKILHVGPNTCAVVYNLLKEDDDTEAWGVEPYDLDDADAKCNSLVRKGIVRVSDIKFPLPYRSKSFSLVIVSDALDICPQSISTRRFLNSPEYLQMDLLFSLVILGSIHLKLMSCPSSVALQNYEVQLGGFVFLSKAR